MPKKIQNTTKATLINVPLPNHAATYTVISHQFVIDYAYQALAAAGFSIVDEEYRCTADGQIAQGIYKLNFNNDPELSMMFAWTNSYNKQVKFKCVVGAYINNSGSVMISGEVGSWVRKHTGSADTETKDTIDQYISNAHMYYNQLCADKAAMELVTLNKRKQSQLLGVLFAEYEILTTEQASMIREQMKRPQQVFKSTDSLWAFYNFVTNALQSSHPKTWMEDQRILHFFIGTICNFSAPPQPVSAPVPDLTTPPQDLSAPVEEEEVVDPLYVILNQINLLDAIAEAELPDNQVVQNGSDFDIDLHQSDEIIEDTNEAEEILLEAIDFHNEVIEYTDPAGNTFEAPIVSPCAGHDAETEKEAFLSLEHTIEDIQAYEEQEQKEYMEPIDANLDLVEEVKEDIKEDDNSDFDLDFGISKDDEDSSNIPDFF